MSSHIVWGLQHLKRELGNSKQEEFADLEENILDLLHRQRLFPEDIELKNKIAELRQKCDALARTATPYTLDDLCVGLPITHFRSTMIPAHATHSAIENVRPAIDLPDVRIQILTDQIPISYCYQKNGNPQDYPLVTLFIDTSHLYYPCTAIINVYFNTYGASTPRQLTLPPGKKNLRYEFLPTISRERLQQIITKCTETIRISVRYLQPALDMQWEESRQVYLLSCDTAILWRYSWNKSIVLYGDYLAAWVTPAELEVKKLLTEATKYHPEHVFQGYDFLNSLPKRTRKREIDKIARAIFEVLHRELHVRYITSALLIPSANEPNMQCIQRVRLPRDCIAAHGPANCLDGSVLFASLLECASLSPALLLLPGHALVGWRVSEGDKEYEFLETTMLAQGDFEQALQKGQEQYREACLKGIVGKEPSFLGEGYALIIDIQKCRQKNIIAM